MASALARADDRILIVGYPHLQVGEEVISKAVHHFLADTFSFPIGEKFGKMKIPLEIYQSDFYKQAFLRGLFDTDGGTHRHHLHSIQIQYTCADSFFLRQVFDLYKSLGFNPGLLERDISIQDRKEVDRFFEIIQPANPRNQYKYQLYKVTRVVPLHRDIDYPTIERWLDARAGN